LPEADLRERALPYATPQGMTCQILKPARQRRRADELQLPITVCHYPPGTSKWNKVEHRLFSFISLNWRGQPLLNFETVVKLIGGTRTRTGLTVKALLDTRDYPTGRTVTDQQVSGLRLTRHAFHPDWNYTLLPRPADRAHL